MDASESLQAGILTIGTEVSNGQIINSNTAWLANEITNLRMNPAWHLTVADLRSDMIDALDFLRKKVKTLVTTGGLGPTSDDFTRNVVAEWAGLPLDFDEASWQNILDRFQQLGVPPTENNKQQCYFPRGATILANRKGTANGFRLEAHGVTLFVLPGPPEEIHAIWGDHIAPELHARTAKADENRLFRWQCMGISESKLGEIVEELIEGSSLVAGYRPHLPYVEIKIWCKVSRLATERHVLDKLEAALSRWVVAKDDEDHLDKLLAHFAGFDEVVIDDQGSFGAISNRIGLKWKDDTRGRVTLVDHFWKSKRPADAPGKGELHLTVGPVDEQGAFELWYKTADLQKLQNLTLPFKRNPKRIDRERLYVCELSLAAFGRLADKGTLVL